MRAFAAVATVLALASCQTDKTEPAKKPTTTSGSGSARSAAPPTGPVAEQLPTIDGAKSLSTAPHGDTHVIATWCIDEQDVAQRIKSSLAAQGWTDIAIRGMGNRMGFAATKPGLKFSARTGGSDQRCAGTLVTATVMRLGATIEIPPADQPIH
ncbi:MAG TPA: hypothetical protein VFQ53_00130 [Kofleriaceae bacterium]|nr:hypothetical protein [Kofleriaceae bacterium]